MAIIIIVCDGGRYEIVESREEGEEVAIIL
jgi:hypothetical protein